LQGCTTQVQRAIHQQPSQPLITGSIPLQNILTMSLMMPTTRLGRCNI